MLPPSPRPPSVLLSIRFPRQPPFDLSYPPFISIVRQDSEVSFDLGLSPIFKILGELKKKTILTLKIPLLTSVAWGGDQAPPILASSLIPPDSSYQTKTPLPQKDNPRIISADLSLI